MAVVSFFFFFFFFFFWFCCDLMVDSAPSGCGLIFMGCDGLILVGGGNCGLFLGFGYGGQW